MIAIRLALWLAGMLAVLPAAYLLIGDTRDRSVFLIVVGGTAFGLITSASISALQGNQTLGKAAVATSVIGVVGQFLILAILLSGGGLLGVAIAGLVMAGVAALAAASIFWSALGHSIRIESHEAKALMRAGIPFLAWDVALFIYGSIGYLILGLLSNSKTVGEYAFAYRLATIPFFFTSIVGAALFPSFASTIQQQVGWTRNALANALRVITLVTLPMACGIALIAPNLGEIAGGGKFEQAGLLIPIVAVSIPLIAIDTVLGTALMARDLQGQWARVAWLASVFNVAANFTLIPLSDALAGRPALGTAISMVLTECLMGAFAWTMMRQYIDFHRVLRELGASVAACTCLSAAFLLAKPVAGLFPAIAAGAVAFIVAALLLNVARLEDARWVQRSLLRRREAETWAT